MRSIWCLFGHTWGPWMPATDDEAVSYRAACTHCDQMATVTATGNVCYETDAEVAEYASPGPGVAPEANSSPADLEAIELGNGDTLRERVDDIVRARLAEMESTATDDLHEQFDLEGESVRAPDILAELTGEPRERFESDVETPSLDELEMVDPDADTEAGDTEADP